MILVSIITLFFSEDEVFAIAGLGIDISSDKKRITSIVEFSQDNNSYGIIEIDSTSDYIYKWDLKIHKIDRCGAIIGISSVITPNTKTCESGGLNYGYWITGEKLTPTEDWP